MTVVKSPVIQLPLNMVKLRYESAAARTNVTRKFKLQSSFYCLTNIVQ